MSNTQATQISSTWRIFNKSSFTPGVKPKPQSQQARELTIPLLLADKTSWFPLCNPHIHTMLSLTSSPCGETDCIPVSVGYLWYNLCEVDRKLSEPQWKPALFSRPKYYRFWKAATAYYILSTTRSYCFRCVYVLTCRGSQKQHQNL